MLRLQHNDLVLELAPEVGGAVAAFYSQAGAVPCHWLRPASARALSQQDPLGMASFPLVPWCNRLRDGRARFGGREIALPPDARFAHALHGLGWRQPWRVRSAGPSQAELGFCFEGEGRPGWPWSFTASQSFRLGRQGLDCHMTLRNDSPAPMPFGLGHHPYFPHLPGTRLQCQVRAMWASDSELLPTELVQPPFLPRLAQGLELAELDLDNNFTGWAHRFTVSWPHRAQQLVLSAESPLDFFVLYCPRGADHFCAEPVSNCTDWLNLCGHPPPERGGGVLAPGQTVAADWSLRLQSVS